MKIQVNKFSGIMPKKAKDKLPEGMAQTVRGAKTESDDIRPYKSPTGDVELSGSSYKTLFEYLESSTSHWCYFDSIVHWARSPVADDTFERLYMTGGPATKAQGVVTFLDSVADGDTVTYSLTGGTDQAAFSIDGNSGVLSFQSAPDFEVPTDSDTNNTYVVEITATDGAGSVTQSVTVTVTDVPGILDIRVSTSDIKIIQFDWSSYVGATHYKLFVNPDGVSGFTLLQDNLVGTSTTIEVPTHFTDWVNASYILEVHDGTGKITESSPISISALMISSIGYMKASNTGMNDAFGGAISLSADSNTLAVGATSEDSNANGISTDGSGEANNSAPSSGAVYVFSRSGNSWIQQAYIKASNTGAGDYFGRAISLSANGNTLAVGATGESSNSTGISTDGTGETDNSTTDSGAVYVFSRSGSTWTQQAYIKASNAETDDRLGSSVSLSSDGNTLAAGTFVEDSNATGISTDGSGEADNSATSSGAVYVFSRSGNSWTQQAYIKASNTEASDNFGIALDLSPDGDTLAVGAYAEDSNATGISTDGTGESDNSAGSSGAVYIFSRSGSTWNQQAYIKASNTDIGDNFGNSVSLSYDGNILAVGAPREDSNATGISTDGTGEADNNLYEPGAVYVFSRSGSTWSQQAYVKASNTGREDSFGKAISLSADGNTLAVGAYVEDSNATGISSDGTGEADNTALSAGTVYVFSRSGNTWSQQSYVKASNTGGSDWFGLLISLNADGNTMAVGAYLEDGNATGIGGDQTNNSVADSGAVYLY